ncbi:MAG: PKD domain-containing protein [Candidatus Bipolaricaulota bacterium]|nr:MAG: PKD domain-containing protein [Candidatus Bipolaricaulota bacterium]
MRSMRGPYRLSPVAALVALLLLVSGCGLFPNFAPIASVSVSTTYGSAPLDVRFDGSDSYDPDGEIRRWTWSFGDGTSERGAIVTHRFDSPGTYLVRLTVRDNRRKSTVTTVAIEVAAFDEVPQPAMVIDPVLGPAPLLVTFDGAGSTDGDGEIVWWEWDFGDGATGVGSIVAHRYLYPGSYRVQLTVTDDGGNEATASGEVVVTVSGTIPLSFSWEYGGEQLDWDVSIPAALINEYRQRLRGLWGLRNYDEFVLDPLDDEVLEELTGWIHDRMGGALYPTLECAFNFVQAAVDYAYDRSGFEYPRYPLESLVDGVGDCEDTAILYASLVRTLGEGAMIVAVDTDGDGVADHMVALAPVDQDYADSVSCAFGCTKSFWTYGDQLYAFAETTGEPDLMGYYFALGCDPWGLEAYDFKMAWDVSSALSEPTFVKWEAP